MRQSSRQWSAAACAMVLALCVAARAADWTQATGQLARQIVAITGPGAASLTLRNISSFPADQAPVVRRTLETQLRSAGVRLTAPGSAAAEIAVTLSENAQEFVWIAEVTQGGDRKVVMVGVPRAQNNSLPQRSASIAIRKTLLWSQEPRVLDVAVLPGGQNVLLLDVDGVTSYKVASGNWQREQTLLMPPEHVFPRDVRGRLVTARDHMFDAYLPGMVCSSNTGAPLTMNCRESEDPWPLGSGQTAFFGPLRNFFTGVLTPGLGKQSSVAPFYSAAALPGPKYTLWVFAYIDGTVHLNDDNLSARGTSEWGSDLALVNSGCGIGAQLLVSGAGDGAAPDVVRAFEIADREPVEVTPPAEMPGPVTALWTAADGRSVLAVAHNLKTNRYDAFELTISCGQ